jgi:hypothetical protein
MQIVESRVDCSWKVVVEDTHREIEGAVGERPILLGVVLVVIAATAIVVKDA